MSENMEIATERKPERTGFGLLLPWKKAAPMLEAPQARTWQDRMKLAQTLCEAVVCRKAKRVHELLESGADMHMRNENGMSALMLAAYRKDRRMLRVLTEHEAGLA